MKRKVCVVLTARASYSKILPILRAIKGQDSLELQIVVAASAVLDRYGSADQMVERDGFTINERIYMVLEAETLLTSVKSTGLGVMEFAATFDRLKPDVVVVMADRYEILAPAIAASYLNIPLAHVQGGEVSGNIDEKVRHAVTKLSDLHFPATHQAADYIIRMGEDPARVVMTGCPSIDVVKEILKKSELDFDPQKKYGGVGAPLDLSKGYVIVMQHAVTTEYKKGRAQITETLKAMQAYGSAVLWFWPNVDAGADDAAKAIRGFRETHNPTNMRFFKNMKPDDFIRLAYNSRGIIGNSSAAIRECSYMGVPAINIGTRQRGRERGPNVLDVDYNAHDILQAAQKWLGDKKTSSHLYGEGNAAQKIAGALASMPMTSDKTLYYPKIITQAQACAE